MPPRLYLFNGGQSLAFRSSKRVVSSSFPARQQLRCITADEKPLPTNETKNPKGPNQDQLPHVSEEAGAMGEITGEGGPDMSQGTPVQDILKRDKDAQDKAPEVLKEGKPMPKSQYTSTPGSSRSFSTSAFRRYPDLTHNAGSSAEPPMPPPQGNLSGSNSSLGEEAENLLANKDQILAETEQMLAVYQSMRDVATDAQGTKFGMPDAKLQWTDHLKHRYHPIVAQLTRLMMQDGKLAKAQKDMEIILNHLRTAPPPKPAANVLPIIQSYYNPPQTGYIPQHATKDIKKRLADPANRPAPIEPSQLIPNLLPLDPVKYLILAIDSVAPLVKVRNQRGVLGGGQALQIPVPLPVKQRRRTAMTWILAAADKRKEVRLADRVAREIVGVMEGRSGAWTRREGVHKLGITARSNIRFQTRRK